MVPGYDLLRSQLPGRPSHDETPATITTPADELISSHHYSGVHRRRLVPLRYNSSSFIIRFPVSIICYLIRIIKWNFYRLIRYPINTIYGVSFRFLSRRGSVVNVFKPVLSDAVVDLAISIVY